MVKPYSFCYLSLLILATTSYAENSKNPNGLIIGKDFKHDISLPLRDMQPNKNVTTRHKYNLPLQHIISDKTSSLNKVTSSLVPIEAFGGIGNSMPNTQITKPQPDLNLAVGTTQIVQYADPDIAVFKKSSEILPGFPKRASSFWAGFGGVCESHASGRLSVKFDELANRWVISQLAIQDKVHGPFFNCTAVSTSEDVTGSYYRYAFKLNTNSTTLRLASWPDAYYIGLTTLTGEVVDGALMCGLERDKMLHGATASIICKQLDKNRSLTPASLIGNTFIPPAGTPAYFLGLKPPDSLILYKFYANFDNAPNTNIYTTEIPVASYKPACEERNGRSCAVQPNTSNKLDIVSDIVLATANYRQFPGGYGSLVAAHAIDGALQDKDPQPKPAPALRWYEFRVDNNSQTRDPVVHQQATLEPDTKNRFAGSISIDPTGNIAIAYTVSSEKVHPSSEMSWHAITDPLNTMTTQPLVTGKGSQTDDISAWTSNTKMVPDPIMPCRMYFTGEHLRHDGSFNWDTGIVQFDLPCPQVHRS